jgi:hypothetical protein
MTPAKRRVAGSLYPAFTDNSRLALDFVGGNFPLMRPKSAQRKKPAVDREAEDRPPARVRSE